MEDIKTFLISDIKEITVDKIIYMDNQVEKEIILKECAENYAHEYNSHIKIEENRCVGERDWFAKNPYFIFFSEPKIKFEIVPKKHLLDCFSKSWHQRYYPEFLNVQIGLQQFNWITYDLG
ncbi:MAG: hypothetical protein LIO71_09870 [Ruminococcus sp.]|nr:hypothetical protein [Ruminococcus sp.]MCD7800800.1 hypothetical protein [Ruminococcus sp.]